MITLGVEPQSATKQRLTPVAHRTPVVPDAHRANERNTMTDETYAKLCRYVKGRARRVNLTGDAATGADLLDEITRLFHGDRQRLGMKFSREEIDYEITDAFRECGLVELRDRIDVEPFVDYVATRINWVTL